MKTLFIILFVASSLFAQQMSKEEFKEKLRNRIKINRADFERCLTQYLKETGKPTRSGFIEFLYKNNTQTAGGLNAR